MSVKKFWRLYITAKNGTQGGVFIGEMEFRTSIPADPNPMSSVDATQGGRAFASSTHDSGAFTADKAFDNGYTAGGQRWISLFGQAMPQFVGCELVTAADIKQLWMVASTDDNSCAENMPKDFQLQEADAEAGPWTTIGTWTNEINWVQGQSRFYTIGAAAPAEPPPPAGDTTKPTLASLGTNADGTRVYVTANEDLLGTSVPAGSDFSMPNHTVTAVTLAGAVATLTVTPAITSTETPQLTYTKGVNPLKDLAGNQLDAFVNQAVPNSVGAGFWQFLGNEGATVTVAANTLVRYGVDGAYVEKRMSGTFTIDNATFTDPAPGSIKHADAYMDTPATGYTVEGPTVGPVGESGVFTVTANGLLPTGLTITPTGTGLTFSPATIVLTNSKLTGTFSAVSTQAGDYTITLANDKGFANPAPLPYKSVTSLLRTFGTGGDYADLDAAIDSIAGMDPAKSKLMIVLEGLSDVAGVNRAVRPVSANESYYVLIRPRKAQGFAVLNAGGAVHENMSGLTMNIPAGGLQIGGGVVIEGWKINITMTEGLRFWSDGAGPISKLRRCFVLCNANDAISNRAYKSSAAEDTFFLRTSAHTGKFIKATWVLILDRCTFLSKGGITPTVHDGGWGNGAMIRDTAYRGFPADFIGQSSGFSKTNNVTNSSLTDATGFTIDTANNFFVDINSNYRAGSALVGKASLFAKSINDILGNNRGLTPDVGAAQQVAALPLVEATVTAQPPPDGQRVVLSGTYTGTLDSATVSFAPADPPDGASFQGPYAVTAATGNWTVTRDDVISGSYKEPVLEFKNAGGTSRATGGIPFEINGVGAGVVDPGVQVAATAVVWSTPASGLVGVESAPFNVGLNGSFTGTVRVTPNDNANGGTFIPAYLDLVNGAGGSFTYTPANVGIKSITLANDKSLANPNPSNYTATEQAAIVSKVDLQLTTDGTTPVADLTNLQYSWFDQTLPQNFTAPKLKGNNGAITGGRFKLDLVGSVLAAGATGFLVLTNSTGDVAQTPAALVFAGPVKVS